MNFIFDNQDKKGLYLVLLILVVFFAFIPSLTNDYVNWDDGPHFLENACVQQPLGAKAIACAFQQFVNDSYIPLTTLSFQVERHFWGMNPAVSHAINLALHVGVTVLVFFIILKLGCSALVSFITALLFGIHPMRVESVAWVTERKDVLYAVFYLWAVFAYMQFIRMREHSAGRGSGLKRMLSFALVLGFSGLAVLAKPMALTLPFALILIDWFLKRKWTLPLVLEKCLVGAMVWPLTWLTYQTHLGKAMEVSLGQKFLIVIWSATFYVRKMVFPGLQVAVYDFPLPVSITVFEYQLAVFVFAFLLAGAYFLRKDRLAVFGIGFYVCMSFYLWGIGTTIGKTHIVADRFTYLSSVGLSLVAAVVWARFWARIKNKRLERILYLGISLAVISIFILKTSTQIFVWKNGMTLWSHQYEHQPHREREKVLAGLMDAVVDQMESRNEGGDGLRKDRCIEDALRQIYPLGEGMDDVSKVKVLNATARYYYYQGKKELALRYWKEALALDPDYYWALYRVAFVAMEEGRQEEALRLLEAAAQRAPAEDRLFQEKVLAAVTEIASHPDAHEYAQDVFKHMKLNHLHWYGP